MLAFSDWLRLHLWLNRAPKYANQMQQELIREIELAHSKYLISVVIGRYLRGPTSVPEDTMTS